MTRVLIAGGDPESIPLLSLVKDLFHTEFIGIYDDRNDSPAAVLAREYGLPFFEDPSGLGELKPDLVLSLADDRPFLERLGAVFEGIQIIQPSCIQFLEGISSRLAEKEAELRGLKKDFEKNILERNIRLSDLNEKLANASRIKSRFFANTSHELRTPLNSIIGFSNVLLEKTFGDLTENQQRYIENINASGQYLLELINNLLDISKIETGNTDLVVERIDLKEFVRETVSSMQPLIDRKLSDFSISIDSGLYTVRADRGKLGQVLCNLISNAIKFTPEGGKAGIRITGEVSRPGGSVRFSVWDEGKGIPDADREKIFDEFEQADDPASRRYDGLGLTLSKKLVRLHSGEIWVESNPGKGSVFHFTIPCAPESECAKPPEPDEFPLSRDDAPVVVIADPGFPSVDDFTLKISDLGYRVEHTFDGEDALRKTRELRPFALILEITLPKKDGWEVLRSLRKDPLTEKIPVIIHSAVDNRDLGIALGATDYLRKPLETGMLSSVLKRIFEEKKHEGRIEILFVGRDRAELEKIRALCDSEDFHFAEQADQALALASSLKPGLIILERTTADETSFFLNKLKNSRSVREIPVFLLGGEELPVNERMELAGKIERTLKKGMLDADLVRKYIKDFALSPAQGEFLDGTGLFNHRYFQLRLAQEMETATRYKTALASMLIDLDDFTKYGTRHGMQAARGIMEKLADLLKKNMRSSDILARFGRDSFALLLPNTGISAARSFGNRVNAIVKNYPFPNAESQPRGKITVSIGVAAMQGQSPEGLLICMETALKRAGERGGDRVEIYERKQA